MNNTQCTKCGGQNFEIRCMDCKPQAINNHTAQERAKQVFAIGCTSKEFNSGVVSVDRLVDEIAKALILTRSEALEDAAKVAESMCENCGGVGFTVKTVEEHGCDGTQESCDVTCPVPGQQQEQCEICARFAFPIAQSIRNKKLEG